ncbi:hypothetical protein HUF18_18315 [Thalassolituus sp. ST750PaO-4]|uniref:hypothetical protein n=1 Tax=Thalassolituus sp. ST750PaO-4 TaxID=2742965 RepID=UPI001CE2E5FA|nr:hypothetical protein [Thalassolituus sp. ST750PaO-4]MCA6061740.1 hypothetical protein [Thalassolituus sp. ST750PaO-4]
MAASLRWFESTEFGKWIQLVDKFGYKWQMATGIALALPDNESGCLVGSAHPTYRHFSLNLCSSVVADKIRSCSAVSVVISGVAFEFLRLQFTVSRLKAAPTTDSCSCSLAGMGMARSYN